MPESGSAIPAAPGGERGATRLGRLVASPLALVIACVAALALVALAGVTAAKFFTPQSDAVSLGTPMPSAFPLELETVSSPFVSRGGTVTLTLNGASTSPVDRVELWVDDHPYIVIDDPGLIPLDEFGRVDLTLDFVPVAAGAHLLVARAIDTLGRVAQSAPVATPVLDLPFDTRIASSTIDDRPADMRFVSAPGDTLQLIADRLGIPRDELATFVPIGDPEAVLPTGTDLTAPVPPPTGIDGQAAGPRFPVADWLSSFVAEEVGCVIRVTSKVDYALRIYGGAGFAALGDLPANGELVLQSLPVGPTTLTGLRVGVTTTELGENEPTTPVIALLPDRCATGGWTGDAYISGGILLTDDPVAQPYAYVSIDKGEWQRVPALEGATLGAATVRWTDIRPYLNLGNYDQIDLEVWTSNGFESSRAAAGQFCRADMAVQNAAASSQGGGECTPPTVKPGAPGGPPVAMNFDLAVSVPSGSSAIESIALAEDPDLLPSITGGGPITLTTNASETGYTAIRYQFSYFPLSRNSPLLNPPGVFHYIDAVAGASTTVEPGLWQNATLTDDELGGTDALALEDELALATSQANLAAGRHMVDDVYIRAIAVMRNADGTVVPLGAETRSVEVMMPSLFDGTWPLIASPQIDFMPGVDQSASWSDAFTEGSTWDPSIQVSDRSNGVWGTCHEVSDYPEAGVYRAYPSLGPFSRPLAKAMATFFAPADQVPFNSANGDYRGYPLPGDVLIDAGNSFFSDLEIANRMYPREDVIYCLDNDASQKRYQAEYEANKDKNKCAIGCVLTFVIYGAAQGFLAGGPYGAIVGALAGLSIGILSAASPQFYKDLKSAWDKIAAVYNAVFDRVWEFVSYLNPICRGIGALDDDAGEFCDGTVQTVGAAVITYYSGLPPSLATSAELDAAADGDLRAAVMVILEQGLNAIGLDCATFELDSETASDIVRAAVGPEVPLGDQGENVSGCSIIAGALTSQARKALNDRQGQLMNIVTGKYVPPGLVISPVSDSVARVEITAPADEPGVSQCPVVVNTTITEGIWTYRLKPTQSTIVRMAGQPTAAGTIGEPFWKAVIPIGVMPQTWWYPQPDQVYNFQDPGFALRHTYEYFDTKTRLIEQTLKKPDARYIRVTVDSPCFDSTYVVDGDKYVTFTDLFTGTRSAFARDPRPAVAYW